MPARTRNTPGGIGGSAPGRALILVTMIVGGGCHSDDRGEAPTPPTKPVQARVPPTGTSAPAGKPAAGKSPAAILDQKKLYSQKDEELIIRDFFQDRRNGFFLDVGCAWPKRNSTTFYLEKHLGWHGIAVDALAEYGEEWARWRKKSKFYAFLVGDKDAGKAPFYRASWTGVSSTKKDRSMMGQKVDMTKIEVQTITLNRLLDDHKVRKLDFLSMDIEGAEVKALAGFDIERFKPELVCIEASPSLRPAILEYFDTHGYQRLDKYLKRDRVNWYFALKPGGGSATSSP